MWKKNSITSNIQNYDPFFFFFTSKHLLVFLRIKTTYIYYKFIINTENIFYGAISISLIELMYEYNDQTVYIAVQDQYY